jgi:hypothetical protein
MSDLEKLSKILTILVQKNLSKAADVFTDRSDESVDELTNYSMRTILKAMAEMQKEGLLK